MASAPQASLPLFYKDLMPLNSRDHGNWRARTADKASWLAGQHAVPVTVEEFPMVQRHFPIVFSGGQNPVPLALMGLNEGVNTFVGDDGTIMDDVYLPAYVRRYPFLLAKLSKDKEELSLCFDPSSGLVGEFKDGNVLFEDGKPTEVTKEMLQFCQRFEEAGQRTAAFIKELQDNGLLMEGEVAIRQEGTGEGKPFIYRGFQMVNEEKLREVRGDKLRTWNKNGFLALVYAHLFSLDLIRAVFGRQVAQGKGPKTPVQAA